MSAPQQNEAEELRRQLAVLQDRIQEMERANYGLMTDDMYEYLIIARTEAMDEKINDVMKYTIETYRKVSEKNETMKKILDYFPGTTTVQRREGLKEFIKQHPSFRTTNPELLLQRIRLHKKYSEQFSTQDIPASPLKDAIDASNTPPPLQRDEEFLE